LAGRPLGSNKPEGRAQGRHCRRGPVPFPIQNRPRCRRRHLELLGKAPKRAVQRTRNPSPFNLAESQQRLPNWCAITREAIVFRPRGERGGRPGRLSGRTHRSRSPGFFPTPSQATIMALFCGRPECALARALSGGGEREAERRTIQGRVASGKAKVFVRKP